MNTERRTYKRMRRVPIPDSQPMGALGQRRDDRARWHILRDGVPMCGRRSPEEIGGRAFYSQVKDRLICKHCHHEFSWRPMPSDVEFQDRGCITPCLIWKGARDPRGYGTRGHFKRQTAVHRDVYEQAHGGGEHVVVHRRTFDYAEAARMYTAGAGPTEIARHFGVKRQTAKAALERMAARGEVVLRPRRRTSAPAVVAEALSLELGLHGAADRQDERYRGERAEADRASGHVGHSRPGGTR